MEESDPDITPSAKDFQNDKWSEATIFSLV